MPSAARYSLDLMPRASPPLTAPSLAQAPGVRKLLYILFCFFHMGEQERVVILDGDHPVHIAPGQSQRSENEGDL